MRPPLDRMRIPERHSHRNMQHQVERTGRRSAAKRVRGSVASPTFCRPATGPMT